MGWFSIIFIIVVGILLMILDFLVIPGGVVAIIGVLGMVAGVAAAFIQYGPLAGFLTLLVTAVFTIGCFVLMMRTKTWRKLQLNTRIDSKMNEFDPQKVHVGMQGKAISRLAPMGTGEFDGAVVEVSSPQDFIEVDTEIEITRIEGGKVFVKPINN
jgi:membrane-bound ClpP family serine protease